MRKPIWNYIALAAGFLTTGILLPLAFPSPLFAHHIEADGLTIYSDEPIESEAALALIEGVKARFAASPISLGEEGAEIFIANSAWRRNWLWLLPSRGSLRGPGGFAPTWLTTKHVFLSGADFDSMQLVAPTGFRPKPPRSLTYYATHEVTHSIVARRIGRFRALSLEPWVREGLADYVAWEPETAADLYAGIGDRYPDLPMMIDHGTYPNYRLLVTILLEEAGWTLDELLKCDLSLEEANAIAFDELGSA